MLIPMGLHCPENREQGRVGGEGRDCEGLELKEHNGIRDETAAKSVERWL